MLNTIFDLKCYYLAAVFESVTGDTLKRPKDRPSPPVVMPSPSAYRCPNE